MKLRWTSEALCDLESISDYLWRHRPPLAQVTIQTLYQGVQSLSRMPHRGRPGAKQGTRELVFQSVPFVLTYRVSLDSIVVLKFRHTSQESF